ncbi:MAG: hypothetical protein AVDCRST_MAG74-3078 [uncultured Pyrinomonadaceae bacterium]|uniref:Uncharacterized protein n=1 Tax=uncultured Pyrinomonadaceae bacterium TaxID=2283094 RepID=A0A6J4PQ02_9BACT|nr:MAG: hypothetical protein AVDCRST_MAG74-3078 [uncultured Pyrinomonadaceae bacterium]
MNMKKQILSFLFLLSLVFSVSAQVKETRKVDEFENTNCDDYRARMDNLLIEVNNFPNAKGYVFVYEGKLKQRIYDKNGKPKGIKYVSPEVGTAKELIGYLKNHLLFRNYPSDKIVFIEAGFREKLAVELWIVPNEVNSPKPTPTLKKIKQRKQTCKPFGFCGEM